MTDVNLYYILDRLEEILDDTRRKEDHVLRGVDVEARANLQLRCRSVEEV
jgi:hypothetical protein